MKVMMAVCPTLNIVPGIEHMLSNVNSREKKKRGSKQGGVKKRGGREIKKEEVCKKVIRK